MRVAFDLDDTLIPCGLDFPTEAPALPWLAWLLRPEPLRVGTTAALAALRADGHELWVYTSSFRSALSVRLTFLCYGLWLDGVINQQRHDARVGRGGPVKDPAAFGVDLLFDDSVAVAEAGGGRVVLVAPEAGLAALVEGRARPTPAPRR
ncbi:MAG: hypothetical protein H6739_07885 [Alphaproteobacteria bacterium]|nr:hypothetical protein [Alphaproteobacteria bacterium]